MLTIINIIIASIHYWSYIITTSNGTRINPNGTGNDSNNCRWSDHLDTGNSQAVHQFRTFKVDVGPVSPGDVISLKMANTASSGALVTGSQYLYAKDFRVYSSTPTVDGSSSTDSLSQSNWSRNVAYFWADRSGNVNFDNPLSPGVHEISHFFITRFLSIDFTPLSPSLSVSK